MGRVRTKTTKRSARMIVEKYYSRLTCDFQTNNRLCEEVAIIPTKRLRNKIAGYITVSLAAVHAAVHAAVLWVSSGCALCVKGA